MAGIDREALTAVEIGGLIVGLSGAEPWTQIGRCSFYQRGRFGVFKLELHGNDDAYTGFAGTYTADSGATDHIVFRFSDFMESTNPTANPNWREVNTLYIKPTRGGGWSWHIGVPEELGADVVFPEQIAAWVAMWNAR